MRWRLPGHMVLLELFFVVFLSVVSALHADEAGVVDWHHKLIGTPIDESTFLHKPIAGSGALAYTLTDRNVLAAVNLRDGAIVWRQLLQDPKLTRPLDGSIAVLSGLNTTIVTTYDAQTGHQLSQSSHQSGSPLDMEILSPDWPNDDTRDIVTLSSGGYIRRLHNHEVVWESSSEDVKGTPLYIATSLSKIFVVYSVPRARHSALSVATVDSVSGAIINVQQLDASLTLESDLQVIGSHSSAPVVIWNEENVIKANVLGSKSVTSLSTAHTFTSFKALAPHSSTSLPHFLVSFTDDKSSWAEIYHIDLQKSSINKAYSLPRSPKSTYSLSQVDANIFFAKVTIESERAEADFQVWSSTSHARLGSWAIQFPSGKYGRTCISVLDVVPKDINSVAARTMITTEDGAIHLLLNHEHIWTREESLAKIQSELTLFLDLPVPEPKVRLNVSASDVLSAYFTRVKTHIQQLRDLPSGLSRFAKHFATGRYEEIELGSVNRDAFGLRKFILTATTTGKITALDSANRGNIVWSKYFGHAMEFKGMWVLRESSAVRGQPPLIGVLLSDHEACKFLQMNGLNGAIVEEDLCQVDMADIVKSFAAPLGLVDTEGRRPIVVVPKYGPAKVLPSGTSLGEFEDIYYSVQELDGIQGYYLDPKTFESVTTWRFEIPKNHRLVSISSRSPEEKIASIGRVQGDRSVLYKYLNPHLLIVVTADVSHSSITVYLIDNVSGVVLHELKHEKVDVTKGVQTQIVENVVYWSYYSTGASGQSRGGRIVVAELYESREKNERFNMSEWSAFNDKYPRVIAQTYLFNHPITALGTTTTRHGITSRDLLIATPHQLIALPKRLLDPRRPVISKNGKLKNDEKEEGLIPYEPVIPDERKWTISHVNELFGVKRIKSSPALLESTSLVLASGLDLFYTRVAPSGSFDVLSESFSRSQLLATIAALAAGLVVMRPLVRRKQLKQRWGET